MTFNNFEKGLFKALAFASIIMLFNFTGDYLNWSITLFESIFVFAFYFFALLVPLYMLVQWIRVTTKERFLKLLIAMLPGLVFSVWFYIMLNALGENLQNF